MPRPAPLTTLADYARALDPYHQHELYQARRDLHEGAGALGLTGIDREGVTLHDGIGIHWFDDGPLDAPLTILYVHGFNISSQSFYMQVRQLRPLGVRQVLIDVRGHGRTGEVAPDLLTVDSAADDIMAVLREQNVAGPLIIVGHSLGGPVSLSLMRRYALELDLAGSVQISSAVDPFTDRGVPRILGGPVGAALYRAVQATPVLSEALRRAITKTLAPILALGFYAPGMSWEVIRFHAAMIQDTPLATYSGFFDDLREHTERGAAEVLATIPGYILVGDIDTVTPLSQSEELHAIWPQAKIQVLPRSGHMPVLDAPGAVSAAIVRLARHVLDA